MRSIIVAALLALPHIASANCQGSGSFQTCMDSSGNSYNVQRYGNTTQVQGFNAQTGSTWSQTSQSVGNTALHNGTASNGNMWSGSSTTFGGTTTHQGVDSQGRLYQRTCNQFGCN